MRRFTGKPNGNRTRGVNPPMNEVTQSAELISGRQGRLDNALGHQPTLSVPPPPAAPTLVPTPVARFQLRCPGSRVWLQRRAPRRPTRRANGHLPLEVTSSCDFQR
jgi:hypothetical protein